MYKYIVCFFKSHYVLNVSDKSVSFVILCIFCPTRPNGEVLIYYLTIVCIFFNQIHDIIDGAATVLGLGVRQSPFSQILGVLWQKSPIFVN